MTGRDAAGEVWPRAWNRPVALVGAGPVSEPLLVAALRVAPLAVGVDGGADRLEASGIRPRAVVGDLDSIADPGRWLKQEIPVWETPNQNATDLEKCLELVRAPLIVGVGFLGGRLDHTLAALGLLANRRRLVLLTGEDLVFAPGRRWQGGLPPGTRISVHAARSVEVLESGGLRWPADGLRLHPGTTRGISNLVVSSPVSLAFSGRGALVVTEARRLEEIADSLLGPSEHPARSGEAGMAGVSETDWKRIPEGSRNGSADGVGHPRS